MILKEAEDKTLQEWSFKPSINEWEPVHAELTQEERWRRLLEPKTTKIQQLEKAKAEKERKEIQKTWSFQPKIKKDVKRVDEKEIVERLHKEANRRQEKREMLKRKMEEERMKNWSFKPEINKGVVSARWFSERRIEDRVQEIQRRVEEEEKYKFKPSINKNSAKIFTK
jgi:hypothetical protein